MEPVAFEDLKIADKLCIVLENGDCLDRVFFHEIKQDKLVVHDYLNDRYIQILKEQIVELSKYEKNNQRKTYEFTMYEIKILNEILSRKYKELEKNVIDMNDNLNHVDVQEVLSVLNDVLRELNK